jgi:hypothetical protein
MPFFTKLRNWSAKETYGCTGGLATSFIHRTQFWATPKTHYGMI